VLNVERKRTAHSCSRSNAAPVPSTHPTVRANAQSHYDVADVPILGRRRSRRRLAFCPSGGTSRRRRRACHVEARGRITKHCLGLWNDEQRDRLARIAAFVSSRGAVPAIQIAHSGRKGSVSRPWEGTQPLSEADGAWETVCPSAVPFGDRKTALREMDETLIAEVIDAFRQSQAARVRPASKSWSCMPRTAISSTNFFRR
jgi:hypothetical protein